MLDTATTKCSISFARYDSSDDGDVGIQYCNGDGTDDRYGAGVGVCSSGLFAVYVCGRQWK